jgi:hypothetical protein
MGRSRTPTQNTAGDLHTCVMRQAFVQEAVLLMEPHHTAA